MCSVSLSMIIVATLLPKSIQIKRTGMYNLYFIHCEPKLKGLVMDGKTIWKSLTGYLPGRTAPLINFYGLMSLAYLILGIYWFSQYARFWREVMQLQNCITLIITLGMFETALWYFEYVEFNNTGVRATAITVWAVTFGTVKRTVARVIILMVSMGYGVVRPTLGGLTSKVLMLGGTFFLASKVLELVENVGAVNDLSGKARLFLVLPVAIMDAFFILWIFSSLSSTLNKLQARRIMAKLEIYRKFTNALAVAVIVSVGWICYEVIFNDGIFVNCSIFSTSKLLYRLMIPLFPIDEPCPVCRKGCLDAFGEHAVHCKELLGFKYRHDLVRDVLFDVLRRAGVSAKKEAPVNFLSDPHEGRSTLRPADVLIYGWIGGKHACVDLTGVSPLVGLGSGEFTVGQAALKVASTKVAKHEKACIDNQHVFIPFAFDTFGFLAPDAVELLKRVQNVMHSNIMTPRSMDVLFRRIGFAIQKGLAVQLVARLPSTSV